MDRPLNVYYIKLFFFSSDLMKLGEVVVCIESRIKFVILVDFVELIHIGNMFPQIRVFPNSGFIFLRWCKKK